MYSGACSALPLLFVCQSATITITQLLPGRLTPFHTRPRHCGSPRLPPASPDGGDPHNTRGATSPSSPFLQSSHATSWLWRRLSRGSVVVFSTNKKGQRHDFHITSKRDIHSPAPDLVAVMNSGIRGHYFIRSGSSIGRANYTGAPLETGLIAGLLGSCTSCIGQSHFCHPLRAFGNMYKCISRLRGS